MCKVIQKPLNTQINMFPCWFFFVFCLYFEHICTFFLHQRAFYTFSGRVNLMLFIVSAKHCKQTIYLPTLHLQTIRLHIICLQIIRPQTTHRTYQRIPCLAISSAATSNCAYQSSPNRDINGAFRNLYTGRCSSLPFATASLHTSQR